jgi:hypothetical protein
MMQGQDDPKDLDAVRARVAESFGRQRLMTAIGAELALITRGSRGAP